VAALVALVPPTVVTRTDTVSTASPAGTVAVICVSLSTVNPAGWSPNDTPVAVVNPVPVSVTGGVVLSAPLFGLMALTVGRPRR